MSHDDDIRKATYLGDGAYIDGGLGEWELFTSNGIRKTNAVFLDNSGVATLLRYFRVRGME